MDLDLLIERFELLEDLTKQAIESGINNRRLLATEEMAELTQVFTKIERLKTGDKGLSPEIEAKDLLKHESEEMADVLICLIQLMYLRKNIDEVLEFMKAKNIRTKERVGYDI